jgi:hypothetical protein
MDQDRQIWQVWASFLHRWGIESWAAEHLEAMHPLLQVGASLLYIAQPLLHNLAPAGHYLALARLLDEPAQAQAFVHYLREATQE